MGKEGSYISLCVSLKPVLRVFVPLLFKGSHYNLLLLYYYMNRVSVLCIFYLRASNNYVSFGKYFINFGINYPYPYFKDINKHTWPNYGDLWKLMPVICGTVSRCNWQIPKRSVQMKFCFRYKRFC